MNIEERRAYQRAWYTKHAAKERARSKEKYKRTKQTHNSRVMKRYWKKKEEINVQQRKNYQVSKEKVLHRTWAWRLKNNFGLTVKEYETLLAKQNGLCAICKRKAFRRLGVDHCHKSGKVRGLLCHSCNIAIGLLKDSVPSAEALVSYLRVSQ